MASASVIFDETNTRTRRRGNTSLQQLHSGISPRGLLYLLIGQKLAEISL